jgi:hypothetical protein
MLAALWIILDSEMKNMAKHFFPAIVCMALALSCVSGGKVTDFSGLEGKTWKLSGIKDGSGIVLLHLDRILLEAAGQGGFFTLSFEGGQYSGQAAPNRYRGPYEAGANQALILKPAAGTLMAGLVSTEGLTENEYFAYLARVTFWSAVTGVLELHSTAPDGKAVTLVFTGD